MKYARLYQSQDTIETVLDLAPEYVAMLAPNKRERLRPLVEEQKPIAGTSQVVERGNLIIEANRVLQTWLVRDKTQTELDRDTNSTEGAMLRALTAALTASIDSPDTTGTAAERLGKLEARVLRMERVARHYLRSMG